MRAGRPKRRQNAFASAGASDFPIAPTLKAIDTEVLWEPQEETGTVLVTTAPTLLTPRIELEVIDPDERDRALVDEGGAHFLKTLSSGERLHIVCLPDTLPDAPLAALVPLGKDGFGRLEALNRLLRSVHRRSVPRDPRLTRQQARRARRMIQAVDGHLCGESYRTIAEVLFGAEPVADEVWKTSSRRYATMDLVRHGLMMIAGGYRKLLRHRPRS